MIKKSAKIAIGIKDPERARFIPALGAFCESSVEERFVGDWQGAHNVIGFKANIIDVLLKIASMVRQF